MKIVFLLMILFFIPFFLFRYIISQPKFSLGDKVRITTGLTQEPLLINNKQLFNVSKISVWLPRFPEYHYGDKLVLAGKIAKGERGWYLEKPEVTRLESSGFLLSLRQPILKLFRKTLPEPEGALVSGITLGAKENLSKEFFSSLKNSGTLHVVVASGMNVTIVARILMGTLLFWVTRRIALPAALLGIWAYVFLIGPDAPIIRAAIMGSLAFLAQALGRVYWAWWSLSLAAATMLLIWPNWIIDVGFLLSFSATAGILAFERPIQGWIEVRAKLAPNFLKQDFSTSLSAQIGVTPILLFAFGQFAPWSPIVNGLLLWTVAPIMILGFLGGIAGLLIEPVGQFLILFTYPLAFLFVRLVGMF